MRGFSRSTLITLLCPCLLGAAALQLVMKKAPRAPHVLRPGDLILRLTANTTRLRQGEEILLTTRIENQGKEPVILCQPGDGSDSGRRTPLIGWSVIGPDDAVTPHPAMPPIARSAGCGNLNELRAEELFELGPGEGREILRPMDLHLLCGLGGGPGTYRLRFYYFNDPKMPWDGVCYNDPRLLKQLEETPKCLLVSNELVIRIEGLQRHPAGRFLRRRARA